MRFLYLLAFIGVVIAPPATAQQASKFGCDAGQVVKLLEGGFLKAEISKLCASESHSLSTARAVPADHDINSLDGI
jgi:hypothetical protein